MYAAQVLLDSPFARGITELIQRLDLEGGTSAMFLPYFTEDFLAIVRGVAEREYQARYRQDDPWVRLLPGAALGIRESQVEVVDLPELFCEPTARTESDADNAIALYEQLKILTPVQASDQRLWACLAHTDVLEVPAYSLARRFSRGFRKCRDTFVFQGQFNGKIGPERNRSALAAARPRRFYLTRRNRTV